MRIGVALLLLGIVALAGCAGLPGADSGVPSGSEAADGYAAVESVSGTVEYRYDSALETSTTTLRVVKRPTERMTRQHFRSPARLSGDVTVTNGTVSWLYDESENAVTRISIEGVSVSNTSNVEFVRRVFGNLTETGENAIVADPSLPVGPLSTGRNPALTTADLAGPTRLAVSYLGTKTIAGRQTYGVELDPVNDTASDDLNSLIENATYWFDAEYFFPLRTETVISIDGNLTRNTRVYTNVTFNPGVPADRFQFEPPPNATVETPPQTRTASFETVSAAVANVSFDVATPEVPDGFDLESARVSRVQNRTTVLLTYGNATREVTLLTQDPPLATPPEGEPVSLGPVNATATSRSDPAVFWWQCDGLGYSIRGDLPPARIEDIARDVATECTGR